VLGGKDDWHGIPKEMMKDEEEGQIEGVFVLAVRKRTSVEVYVGSPSQLVSSRAELSLVADQYHFDFAARGNFVRCVQVPNVMLERIITFPHSNEDREQLRKRKESSTEPLLGCYRIVQSQKACRWPFRLNRCNGDVDQIVADSEGHPSTMRSFVQQSIGAGAAFR